jgi:thiol-disulfide isomerase/thioredoxin
VASALHTQSPLSVLDRAPTWLNSAQLTAARLSERVVLVDFWTYSCVNWLRTLPYLKAWHMKYRNRGLTIVGAHSPEFAFERDLDNVRRAAGELEVDYPVVIDNEFAIWQAFGNRFWPAIYLLDRDGHVYFEHVGEGAYEETERAIQNLLSLDEQITPVDASGISEAADFATLRSPETYLGCLRGERRSNPPLDLLALNHWTLTGAWSVGEQAAVLEAAAGSIAYRFQARDVNLVLAPPAPWASTRFAVLLDGRPPGDSHGLDVDATGMGVAHTPRMYQLVRRRSAPGPRTFEIEFLDPGVRAFVFTFG